MSRPRLPESLRQFVARQTTMAVTDLWDGGRKEQRSPYGRYWYRAVACVLLSGRVQAKHDGTPNMTDVNRVGKVANFNQYLTERVGTVDDGKIAAPGGGRRAAEKCSALGPTHL